MKKLLYICALVIILASCGLSAEQTGKAQAHFKLGVSYLSDNNIQPAYLEFQKAVEIDPDNKDFHNALGIVFMKLEDKKKAEESFKKAVRIDSEYSEGHNNLCYLYYLDKKFDSAISSCTKALANQMYMTPEKAFYNLGRVYYRQGKYDDAIKVFWEAIRRNTAIYLPYYWLALSHNAKGEYGEASTQLMKALELNPRFRGDKAKAEAEFKSGKSPDVDDPKDAKDLIEILRY